MGVPKFYRWISERYPCLSQVVQQNQIPEFDNFYLDMNGIIHTCSHPNDDDPHFRISEEQIFKDICHYIEFLFRMIKPKRVFFMAVDGVAPRAKMNQQRARRFRTAKEAELQEKRALERGETLPNEARFDSNCITPGTEFMTRLHEVLKYFVVSKISTDKAWQDMKIYLSGHETPGEGEHKIMDFIRHERSQPGYDPNTRHCLYGLDADLIMLGLCTHEPHFAILREEVVFGWKHPKKSRVVPEHTSFHLLHLSLMREYLDFEFSALKKTLSFPYNLENIIDDWILMGFLVGNDFIPNLPYLHIQHDALRILYKVYIKVLPTLDGYINENGKLNLQRFEKYLKELSQHDYEKFNDTYADLKYWEGKTGRKLDSDERIDKKSMDFLSCLDKLNDKMDSLSVEENNTSDDNSDSSEELFELEFQQHKRNYYMNKLDYENVTIDVLKEQAYCYVQAIQWNLHYYYNSVISWSWFYPHHYAPYISDIKEFCDLELHFEKGKPFLPFQQLLSVLPAACKNLLPLPYQKLMTDSDSPLKSFYPENFKTDLNGKSQDWEAVVLIPFINEKLLLENTENADKLLSKEEKNRNKHGPHLLYTYSERSQGLYKSPQPDMFSDVVNHSHCMEIDGNHFRLPVEKIKKGLLANTNKDVYTLGFPTFKHIKHTAELKNERIKVFHAISSGENMIITIKQRIKKNLEELAQELIGKSIFVRWPHLVEALVVDVSNINQRFYIFENKSKKSSVNEENLTESDQNQWRKESESIVDRLFERFGIIVGEVEVIVKAKLLTGRKYFCTPDGKVIFEKLWSPSKENFPLQATVKDIAVNNSAVQSVDLTINELYPTGSKCFVLNYPYYGCMAEIVDCNLVENKGYIKIKVEIPNHPDFREIITNEKYICMNNYMPGYLVARKLGIGSYLFSRMTGTFFVQTNSRESMNANKVNIGLNLKFNAKNEEIPGFSKKSDDGTWLYSDKALEIMDNYLREFPELFEKLVTLSDHDIVHISNLFSSEEDGKEMLKKITNWLKSQPCASVERRSCNARVLDISIVKVIEDVVDNNQKSENKSKYVLTLEKPNLLYCPANTVGWSAPDPQAKYELYDRVIAVQENHTVPLGTRGTVIGINENEKQNETLYTIVFDNEFTGGLELNCSKSRGYQMKPSDLINISYGERVNLLDIGKNFKSNQQSIYNEEKYLWGSPEQGKLKKRTFRQKYVPPRLQGSPRISSDKISILKQESDNSIQSNEMAQKSTSYNMKPTSPLQQLNHSPHSPFIPQDREMNENETPEKTNVQKFITPKVPTNHAKDFSQRTGTQDFKMKQTKIDDFENIWEGLRQTRDPFPPQPSGGHPAFSKQLSVEELFQGAKEAENAINQSISLKPNAYSSDKMLNRHKSCAITELNNLSNSLWKKSPIYKDLTAGPMSTCQAEVILPNGKNFNSIISPSIQKARESAAEQALAFMKRINNTPVIWKTHNPFVNLGSCIRPNSAFSPNISAYSPINSYTVPQFPFSHQRAPTGDTFLMRHPPPPPTAFIPESFVNSNRQILDGPLPVASQINHTMNKPPFFISNSTKKSVVNKTCESTRKTEFSQKQLKNERNDSSDMFVPLQVTKQQSALKKNQEENKNSTKSSQESDSAGGKSKSSQSLPKKETQTKKKQQRKSRLAVKFGNDGS
ncbi:5'-3' exoribonuclease 1 isoform X2 [Centruroides vittatus]|uniref:5'-3' exoribonuclease 1 isoform X2 n=1 Tax=Centruroides vittatus TaxID=120091 RepID=UPI0035108DD0